MIATVILDRKRHDRGCTVLTGGQKLMKRSKITSSPVNHVKFARICQTNSQMMEPCLFKKLFERPAVDYIGPFPISENKNRYVIMAAEYYTCWPIAKAVRTADFDTTIKFLYEDLFCQFGPFKVLTDNGSHFASEEVEKFVRYVNVKH